MALVVAHLDTPVRGVLSAIAVPSMDGVEPRRPIVFQHLVAKLHMEPVHEVGIDSFWKEL
jgi:hypothetical protein